MDIEAGIMLLGMTAIVIQFGLLKKKRNRRFKVRPMNRNRHQVSVYTNLLRFAKENDKGQFFKYTRMTPEIFDRLLHIIRPYITNDVTKNPIPPEQRLAITLHYLSEECSMQEVAWNNYIGHTTAHCIIKETCHVLWDVLQPIVLPSPSKEDLTKISIDFYKKWNIPKCIGALDGKHVVIQCPKYSGSLYFSYKKSFSIILMAVCDAYYKFTYVDIGGAGANHDGAVFKESGCGKALMAGTLDVPDPKVLPGTIILFPHFFVADAAFPLHENIMRPYPGSYLKDAENLFNMRLSRARRCIENTFGILAQRWRRLRSPIIGSVETCEVMVQAVVVLHNFIQKGEEDIPENERQYCPTGFTDREDPDGDIREGEWRNLEHKLQSIGRIGSNNAAQRLQKLRNMLAEYFVSPLGAIVNQWVGVYVGAVPDSFKLKPLMSVYSHHERAKDDIV